MDVREMTRLRSDSHGHVSYAWRDEYAVWNDCLHPTREICEGAPSEMAWWWSVLLMNMVQAMPRGA